MEQLENAVNDVIAGQLAEKLHFSQRGFTRGRQFLLNVVELDILGRKFAVKASANLIPLLALLDFCQAFPSIAHRYLFLVIELDIEPESIRVLLEAFYTFAHVNHGGHDDDCGCREKVLLLVLAFLCPLYIDIISCAP